MGNQQERSAFDIGWLVGIIEGEGHVGLNKKTRGYHPSIQIGNTNQGIIDRLTRILESLGLTYCKASSFVTKGGKTFQRVDISGYDRLVRFFGVVKVDYFEGKWMEVHLLKSYIDVRTAKGGLASFGNEEEGIYQQFRGMGR